MSFEVACSGCRQKFVARPDLAGKTVACPACGAPFAIPTSHSTTAASPATAADVPLVVNCRCGRRFSVPAALGGRLFACPGCHGQIQIPLIQPPDSLDEAIRMEQATPVAPLHPPSPRAYQPPPRPRAPRRRRWNYRLRLGCGQWVALFFALFALSLVVAFVLGVVKGFKNVNAHRQGITLWEPYESKAGKFTISMPWNVETSSTEVTKPGGRGKVKVYFAVGEGADGSVFAVSYFDLPPGTIKINPSAGMVDPQVAKALALKGRLRESKDFKTFDSDGKEYVMETNVETRPRDLHGRSFRIGNRVFELYCESKQGSLPDSTSRQFLDSFSYFGH